MILYDEDTARRLSEEEDFRIVDWRNVLLRLDDGRYVKLADVVETVIENFAVDVDLVDITTIGDVYRRFIKAYPEKERIQCSN